MSEWIEWTGGACPIPAGTPVQVRHRNGEEFNCRAGLGHAESWGRMAGQPLSSDIVAYRVVDLEQAPSLAPTDSGSGGGKLKGDSYYRATVTAPVSDELQPYTAECADIIEALDMTFNEGEAFKALWRLAAARQGRGKPGNKPQYDADKAAHYGQRVAAHTRKTQEKASTK